MGTLTLAEIKTEVLTNLGGRSDQDDRITRIINLAQVRIARRGNFRELRALLSDTTSAAGGETGKFLAVPATLREIFSLVLLDGTSSRKLTQITAKQFDKYVPAPQVYDTGRPSIFILYKDFIEFWRVPDQAYEVRLRCNLWPTAFTDTSTSATSDLDEKDDIIIALTTAMIFDSLRMEKDADKYFKIYGSMMREALDESEYQPGQDIVPAFEVGAGDTTDYHLNPWQRHMP